MKNIFLSSYPFIYSGKSHYHSVLSNIVAPPNMLCNYRSYTAISLNIHLLLTIRLSVKPDSPLIILFYSITNMYIS